MLGLLFTFNIGAIFQLLLDLARRRRATLSSWRWGYTCVTCHVSRVAGGQGAAADRGGLQAGGVRRGGGGGGAAHPPAQVPGEKTSWELISWLLWERIYLQCPWQNLLAGVLVPPQPRGRPRLLPHGVCVRDSARWQEGLNVLTFGRYIISIQGVSVELSMMYAGSKNNLVK